MGAERTAKTREVEERTLKGHHFKYAFVGGDERNRIEAPRTACSHVVRGKAENM